MYVSQIFNNIESFKNINKLIDNYQKSVKSSKSHNVSNKHYPFEIERMFYESLLNNLDDEIIKYGRLLSKYQVSNFCEGNEIRSLKNNIIGSCAVLVRYVIQAGVDERAAFELADEYIYLVEAATSLDDLYCLSDLIYLNFIQEIKKHKILSIYSKSVTQAINYIDSNIEKNISLNVISKHLNINDKYLSKLFKKETGNTITNYIHYKKIIHAKYLFAYTNMGILEISQQLSFNSQEYFSKVFKQFESISPGAYMRRLGR
ncbi:helix-turn-helix domain-containing protein [Clostridiaceae bacterium M8S5]|nr:helix-turn-helix domain-containing protein [Clostridiaceae bacterium M8S5]